MGATAAVVTVAALAGGYKAYSEGRAERDALKQQYQIDEYNAQMDKMETEVDLARQEKLLQKQLAQTMATQNNLFGQAGLDVGSGSAANLLEGSFSQGQDETRSIYQNVYNAQNKYIYNEAVRRKQFNKNLRNNRINTIVNTGVSAFQSGLMAYSAMSAAGGGVPVKDVTGTAGSGGNVTFTNASYAGV